MDITITDGSAKATLHIDRAKFRPGFLKICPVPMKNMATHPDPPDMQPEMTELQWLKKVIRRDLFDKYKQGKMLIARELEVIDEDVIT